MMQNNDPVGIVMQYMQGGADVRTALQRAAQQHPDIFPQQQVALAMTILAKPAPTRRQALANMAKERGLDLNEYIASLQAQAQRMR